MIKDSQQTPQSGRRRAIAMMLIGILFFLIGLMTQLPAAQAWTWVNDDVPAQAYGIRGTPWSGNADAVISGAHRVDAVSWQLRPAELLKGQLRYDLRAQISDGRIEGTMRTSLGGTIRLRNIRFDMSADELLRRFGGPDLPVSVGGRVDAFFEEIVIGPDGQPQRLRGLVNWSNGSIAIVEPMPLGNYALRIDSQDGQISGNLIDTDAVLRLDGHVTLDAASGDVNGKVIMQALEEASTALVDGLRFSGLPQPAAENRIHFNGNVNNPLGFRGEVQ